MPQGDTSAQPGGKKNRGEKNMFDLMRTSNAALEDEQVDVERGLLRFKKDTGVDFLELMHDKRLRAEVLINGIDRHDTDDDEEQLQRIYGPLQEKAVQRSGESE